MTTDKSKKDGKKPGEATKPTGGDKVGGGATAPQGVPQKAPLTPKPVAGFSLENLMQTYGKRRMLLQKQHEALKTRMTRYQQQIDKLTGEVAKITAKLGTIAIPSFVDVFVKPIAAELHKHFPKTVVDITGPMGVMEAVTITFSAEDASADQKMTGLKSKSITLLPSKDGIAVRDYSKDTKEYQPGSLGYASGLNHPTITVPANADVKWFVAMVK